MNPDTAKHLVKLARAGMAIKQTPLTGMTTGSDVIVGIRELHKLLRLARWVDQMDKDGDLAL